MTCKSSIDVIFTQMAVFCLEVCHACLKSLISVITLICLETCTFMLIGVIALICLEACHIKYLLRLLV